jgi:ATP-dependent Clp protease ATP-binding subunit ClpA
MFSKTLELSLHNAFIEARAKHHEYITVEHLLLGLLDNKDVKDALIAFGADPEKLRKRLAVTIERSSNHLVNEENREIMPTLSFQRVLQKAIAQVQMTGGAEVTAIDVLLALFDEEECQAVQLLSRANVSKNDILDYAAHILSKPPPENDFLTFEESQKIDEEYTYDKPGEEILIENYAINLNEKASLGKIDPLIGRYEEIDRSLQVLCRRRKNNPLLVGEAGVGKTAIVEGLAQRIVNKDVPEHLQDCTIYSLDLALLLAGTKYRGDFEKRLKNVLQCLMDLKNAIVFIDEIHNIVGAGCATGGSLDAANLLKPILSSGELRCIGATTYEEYRKFFDKDTALSRRFQKVDVTEPSSDQTIQILKGLKSHFEKFHSVEYTENALNRAVQLATKYMIDRHLPDKAIDVIDEAGAYSRLQSANKAKKIIRSKHIEKVVAEMIRIPLAQLTTSDKQKLQSLSDRLKKVIFDQDQAVDILSDAIKLSHSGLRDPRKPIGSFLLMGPTGVGKTEVTKQLAKELGVEFLRYDMSEYMEKHAVSRLIGSPPGYVGYDQGGLLVDGVIKHPYAVLLLDEIEKAHPDIINLLLQVMDYGCLTDSCGRKADFRHVVIVMTSNIGSDLLEKEGIGFVNDDKAGDDLQAVKQFFTPEFRNRLDAIVPFKHLAAETMLKIVDKNIIELIQQLSEKNINIKISVSAKRWLAEKGYHYKMGARPIERVIQENLKKLLADEILFGQLAEGSGLIHVSVVNGTLKIAVK